MPMHRRKPFTDNDEYEEWSAIWDILDTTVDDTKKIEKIRSLLRSRPSIGYNTINFNGKTLKLDDIKHFSEILLSEPLKQIPIKFVAFRRTPLQKSIIFIIDAFKKRPGLKSLVLNSAQLGPGDAQTLVDAFKEEGNFLQLNALSLHRNNLGNKGAIAVSQLFEARNQIKILDLGSNEIGDEGIAALANALKQNSSLTWLSLANNSIGMAGIEALAALLQENTSLRELMLGSSSVQMELDSFKILMRALEENNTLTHLELNSLRLGSRNGMGALEALLKKNVTLTSLELSHNLLNDVDVERIAEGLKSNSGLKYLGLKWNAITDEGIAYLAEALKENASLIHLDLSHTVIGEEGAKHLLKALETNHTLLEIDLEEHKGISNETWIQIRECLNRNRLLAAEPVPMPEKFPDANTWGIVTEYLGKPSKEYLEPITKERIKTQWTPEDLKGIPIESRGPTKQITSFFSKLRSWLNSIGKAIADAANWVKNKLSATTSASTSAQQSEAPAPPQGPGPSKTVDSTNPQTSQAVPMPKVEKDTPQQKNDNTRKTEKGYKK